MKKLFALIFAAVLFAGCSNNVDNNDAAKFALFNRQNNTEKYSLKINLFAEQSRTITPFDSDEAYVNAVSKVEKWDLVFTDNEDESNNFSISQLQAQNGVLLVKTGKTGDFKVEISGSIEIDGASLNNCDMETILQLMPNRRYSYLIRLRYIEGHSNEETAQIMGMNMNTFYNKHKMAKEQFVKILRKEENYYG